MASNSIPNLTPPANLRTSECRIVEVQTLGPDPENCAVSWTGGKDCNLALLHAWRDPTLRVTALVVFRPQNAQFRAHPIELMEAQATKLQLPLLHVVIDAGGTGSSYKDAYIGGLRELRAGEHAISVIATGDMDLVGSMPRNWIEDCCEAADCEMRAFLPLWKADREEVLKRLLAEGLRPVFSCVKSPWFDASWVGRALDADAIAEMTAIRDGEVTSPNRLDVCGENGEFHTMCIDGPLYSSAVELLDARSVVRELVDQAGQKPGERWWCLNLGDQGLKRRKL